MYVRGFTIGFMKGTGEKMIEKKTRKRTKKMILLTISIITVIAVLLCGCSLPFGSSEKKYTTTDYAMGTVINQTIYYVEKNSIGTEKKNSVLVDVQNEIERLERDVLSVRYEDSAISRMNSGETGPDAEGSSTSEDTAEFLEYLNQSEELSKNSSGAFSPSIGKLIRLWDIDGENPHKPEDSEIKEVLEEIKADFTYDLGAVGKGIACDNVEKILTSAKHADHVKGAIIAVGGSVLVHGKKSDDDSWEIAITNPRKTDTSSDYLGTLSISDADKEPVFISTSGDYEKYFVQDGVRYHHILDPSTGYPADSGLISVTIIIRGGNHGGLLSDGLSTACFVLGIEKSLPLLKKYDAEAVFVDRNKNITMTEKAAGMFTLLDDSYKILN